MTGAVTENVALNQAIREFLARPRRERESARLGKGKLHDVYRFHFEGVSYILKIKGRETIGVRIANLWKGIRHFAVTGEQTRIKHSRVAARWKNELVTAIKWKKMGLPAVSIVPFPDENVRVVLDIGFGTLADHLRDPQKDRKYKLYSLMEVAGIMFARHTMVSAAGDPHLFHEEPHTANLLYRPGELVYCDQEFLPDEKLPDIHHAACELISLTQSAIRDLNYENVPEIVAAIAHGYPDPQVLETVARLLDVRRPRWRFLSPRRTPVSTEELAAMFRQHTTPEERLRPSARPVPLGMPGDLSVRPDRNQLG